MKNKNVKLKIFEQGRLSDNESSQISGGDGSSCPGNYSQQCAPRYAVMCMWFTYCGTTAGGAGFQLCYEDTYTICGDYKIQWEAI